MAEAALCRRATATKVLLAAALAVPAAALTAWDEVLMAGPIIFLVEALGFVLGFLVFTAAWAALGLALLAVVDFVWSRIGPSVNRAFDRALNFIATYLDRAKQLPRAATFVAAGLSVLAAAFGAAVYVALLGSATVGFVGDNREAIATGLLVGLGVLVVVGLLNLARRQVEAWVRWVAGTAKPLLRPLGALASMVVFGPVLGWPLFRLLGYRRATTYYLTLVAAPIFAAIWVPFYGLGIWGVVQPQFT
jgi:F0F1-type ATP synthase membrane subunit c/vacuolar-type H+-ATPase subunit K